jgi:hypothetical protein
MQNEPTAQVIAWLLHDVEVAAVARCVVQREEESQVTLAEWMRCRLNQCGLAHSSNDVPGSAIPSLYDLQQRFTPEAFDQVDWAQVRWELGVR